MLAQDIVIERWTAQLLLAIWGIFQSLALEYLPYLSDWYLPLNKRWKRLTQAIGLAIVSVIVVVLACNDILGGIACTRGGVIEVISVWIVSLMANQSAHLVFKKDSSG